jgi:hypothetical protein
VVRDRHRTDDRHQKIGSCFLFLTDQQTMSASPDAIEHRLFVGGLPNTTTSDEMSSRFGKFGSVVRVALAPVTDAADPAGA